MTDWISRRTALAALAAPALPLASATPGMAAAQAPPPASPGQKLEKSYADVKDTSQQLSQISVPMSLEPATAFHV